MRKSRARAYFSFRNMETGRGRGAAFDVGFLLVNKGESILRVFPISNWTETDITAVH